MKSNKASAAKKVTKAAAAKKDKNTTAKKVTKAAAAKADKDSKARKVTRSAAAKAGNGTKRKATKTAPSKGKVAVKGGKHGSSSAKKTPVKSSSSAKAKPKTAAAVKTVGRSKPKHGKRAALAFDWRALLLALFALFLAGIIAVSIYVGIIIVNTPKIDADNIYSMLSQSSKVYDRKGNEVQTLFIGENRTNVKYKNMPDNLVNAFVALEDKTFWKHHGFNIIRIFGAIKDKFTSGGSVGGTSTITQQLARNVFLKTRMSERTMKRKIQEAWYAIQIEHSLSKEEIMEAYSILFISASTATEYLQHQRHISIRKSKS